MVLGASSGGTTATGHVGSSSVLLPRTVCDHKATLVPPLALGLIERAICGVQQIAGFCGVLVRCGESTTNTDGDRDR